MPKVGDIFDVINKGFAPYPGEVDEKAYVQLKCKTPVKARWYVKRWGKRTILLCIGCHKNCTPGTMKGFQPVLPFQCDGRFKVPFAILPMLSAEEMLKKLKVLRVAQAAYCLNVSEGTVLNMIDEGRLVCLERTPVRITSESIQKELSAIKHG